MNDTKYADAAIAQLEKPHDRPFLIACGVFHPHMPWYVPQKYFDMFPLDEVTVPELLEGDIDDLPRTGRSIAKNKSRFVDQVLENGLQKQAVQAYLATTAYSDADMAQRKPISNFKRKISFQYVAYGPTKSTHTLKSPSRSVGS